MKISTPPFDPVHFKDSDLLDSAFHAETDMHALWAHLRDNDPVHRADPGDGREPFWVVTRHEEVSRVLRDHQVFSSRRGTILCVLDLNTPDIATDDMLADTDPPRHGQFRQPLNKAFGPKVVATQEDAIRDLTRKMLREAIESDVHDIAHPAMMFPMVVTGTLMGLPPDSWERLQELVMMTIAYDDPAYSTGDGQATVRQARHEMFEYFREQWARRTRDDDNPDVIGTLRGMDLEEGPMSERQALLNCFVLLIGANVTTPHALGTLFTLMDKHPETFHMVRENRDLRPNCLEELLRWSSPVTALMRYATEDVELQGKTIRAGEPVSAWLGSANRDERVFENPYTFDPTRRPNKHVAFGVGPHYCIGAGLAKVGLRIFFDELLDMVDTVEIAGDVEHVASHFVSGYKKMPLRFTPLKSAA